MEIPTWGGVFSFQSVLKSISNAILVHSTLYFEWLLVYFILSAFIYFFIVKHFATALKSVFYDYSLIVVVVVVAVVIVCVKMIRN